MQADYVTVVEDRPIMYAKYRLTVAFGQNWPTMQRGLSAIAELELLVIFPVDTHHRKSYSYNTSIWHQMTFRDTVVLSVIPDSCLNFG